jgi:hypothetical protein
LFIIPQPRLLRRRTARLSFDSRLSSAAIAQYVIFFIATHDDYILLAPFTFGPFATNADSELPEREGGSPRGRNTFETIQRDSGEISEGSSGSVEMGRQQECRRIAAGRYVEGGCRNVWASTWVKERYEYKDGW